MNTLSYILGRIWSGNTSLAKLYWGYGIVGGIFWGVILTLVTPGSVGAIVSCVLFSAFYIFVSVGMWRAAGKYQGWFVWAGFAKIAAALGVLQSILLAGVLAFVFFEVLTTGPKTQQSNNFPAQVSAYEPQQELAPPTIAPQSQNQAQYADPLDREVALMDQTHPGWRQKVVSPQFGNWLSRQDQATRNNFETAETAAKLAVLINRYDRWAAAQQRLANSAPTQKLTEAQPPKKHSQPDSPEKVDRILQQMSEWDNRHTQRLYEGRN